MVGPNGLDMLELRLRTLDPFVDWFVVTEATWSHTGLPKRLELLEAGDRFAPWLDKIRYVPLSRDPGLDTWNREKVQRDNLMWGLRGIGPGDVILHGDVDEIPDLRGWQPSGEMEVFGQQLRIFAVDWHSPDEWPGTIAARWGSFGNFSWLRDQRFELPVTPGGWHFSWLGGPDAIRVKARNMAHGEWKDAMLSAVDAGRCYEDGWIPWLDQHLVPVEVDETWPDWISGRDCPAAWFRPR